MGCSNKWLGIAALLWMVACGDDGSSSDSSLPNGQDTSPSGNGHAGHNSGGSSGISDATNGGSTGMPSSGAEDAGSSGMVEEQDAAAPTTGACTNEADQAVMAATFEDDKTFDDVVTDCGNAFAVLPIGETVDCIVDKTGSSSACADCYGDTIDCAQEHCKLECAASDEACSKCLCEHDCRQNLATCTGLPTTDCQ